MKLSIINNSAFHAYDTCDSIRLPEEVFKQLGIDDGDFANIDFVDGKLIISPRKVKCVITHDELSEAFDSMVSVAGDSIYEDSIDTLYEGVKAFLKELNIKVDD